MRVAVLPRDVSARVITSSLARAFGAVNAVNLGLGIPLLADYVISRGVEPWPVVPFLILVILLGISVAAAVRPTMLVLVLMLVVGTIGAISFQLLLLAAHPAILDDGLYALNRPAVALVLVGVAASTVMAAVIWAVVGFVLSTLVTLVVAIVAGVPFSPGWGPAFTLALILVAYGALALIQMSLRRRVPDFDALEEQVSRIEFSEDLRARVTAAVHDTFLNDLSLVMNAPDTLDERMRSRLRQDVATLTSAEWLRESAVVIDDQDADLRNRVTLLINDLQWRGLTVHVTGGGAGIYRLAPEAPDVLIDVARACLENVLRHSGVTVAELDLAYTDTAITLVITDQGAGFDPTDVAEDRLGLRHSVIERVRSIGGRTKIWSTPGEGTSIMVTVPVARLITRHEKSTHGDS